MWRRDRDRPARRLGGLAGAAAAGVLVAGLLSGIVTTTYFTSGAITLYRPGNAFFCSRCHPNIVKAWQRSTHAAVRCVDCHSRHGSLGFWSENLYAAQVTWTALNGRWRELVPFRTQVFDTGCLKCHMRRVYGTRTGRWIAGASDPVRHADRLFTHRDIYLRGYKCTRCHSTVVEGDLIPPGSRTYPHLPTDVPTRPASAAATGGAAATDMAAQSTAMIPQKRHNLRPSAAEGDRLTASN